mgnify:CR=1 FL=1
MLEKCTFLINKINSLENEGKKISNKYIYLYDLSFLYVAGYNLTVKEDGTLKQYFKL